MPTTTTYDLSACTCCSYEFGCTSCSDGAPKDYDADMSGFAQGVGTCTTCGSVSTVPLTFISNTMGDCLWEGEFTLCSTTYTVKLIMMSGSVTINVVDGGGFIVAIYDPTSPPFDCLAGGSFSLTSGGGDVNCSIWPTTISLTAA